MKSFWPPIMRLSLQWTVAVVLLAGAAQAQGLEPLQRGGSSGCAAKVAVMPSAPPLVVDYSLWRTMTQAWNAQTTSLQTIMKNRLSLLPLRDVSVSLQPAPFSPIGPTLDELCSFVADPARKTFQLSYRTRGNRMSALHRNLFGPQPKVSGTFDLVVAMTFTTNGPGGEPVVLRGARVTFGSFRFTGDPKASGDAKTIGAQTFPDAGVGTFVAVDANRFFRLLPGNQAVAGVTPGVRPVSGAPRLFFDLRVVRPPSAVGILQ